MFLKYSIFFPINPYGVSHHWRLNCLIVSTLQQLTVVASNNICLFTSFFFIFFNTSNQSNKSLQWNNSLLLFSIGATKKLGGYNIKNLSYLNLDYFMNLVNLRNFTNLDPWEFDIKLNHIFISKEILVWIH